MKRFHVPSIRIRVEKLNSLLKKRNVIYICDENVSGMRDLVEDFLEFNFDQEFYSFYIDAFSYENIFIDLIKWLNKLEMDQERVVRREAFKDQNLIENIQAMTQSKCYFIFENANKRSRLERLLNYSNNNIIFLILTNQDEWIPNDSLRFSSNLYFNKSQCIDLIQYELNVQYRLMISNLESILNCIFNENTIPQDDIKFLIQLFNRNPYWKLENLLEFYSNRIKLLKEKHSAIRDTDMKEISCLRILQLFKYSCSNDISYDLLERLFISKQDNLQNQFNQNLDYLVENGFLKKRNLNLMYHYSEEKKEKCDNEYIVYTISKSTRDALDKSDSNSIEKFKYFATLISDYKSKTCLEKIKLQNKIIRSNYKVFFMNQKSQIQKLNEKLDEFKSEFCSNDYNFSFEFICEYIDFQLKQNSQLIDLNEIKIDKPMLKYIKNLISDSNKRIKIESDSNHKYNVELKEFAKNFWIENFHIFNYPSDEVYCLMCLANYNKAKYFHDLERLGWEIQKNIEYNKDISYTILLNKKMKHYVIAYQGKLFETNDLAYASMEKMDEFIQINLANEFFNEILYDLVERMSYQISEYKYILSFTGYGLGGLYAQLSLLYCHRDLDLKRVRAVTFESPGCENILKAYCTKDKCDFKKFDIRTYLKTHNFLNTSGKHLGKVFSITKENNYPRTDLLNNNLKISNTEEM